MKKRFLAMLLTLCMVLSLVPTAALAEEAWEKSTTPTTSTPVVAKTTSPQAEVVFRLTNEPLYAESGVEGVAYDSNEATDPRFDITAICSGNTITLRHETDLPEGTYYVCVQEHHKDWSDRVALTVGGVATPPEVPQGGYEEPQDEYLSSDTRLTAGKTYIIRNKADLDTLAGLIGMKRIAGSVRQVDAEGCTFALADDFDNSNEPFTGTIGYYTDSGNRVDSFTPSFSFSGTFLGRGKTIHLANNGNRDGRSTGLFGYLDKGGKIQDLTVVGSVTGGSHVGGIVGYNSGTVQNCKNAATITGTNYVGGITGYNGTRRSAGSAPATIKNCVNTGALKGEACVGGMAGQGGGEITNCYNTGIITANQEGGGILGKTELTYTVKYCYNTGDIQTPIYAGGIVGKEDDVEHTAAKRVTAQCVSLGTTVMGGYEYGRVTGGAATLGVRENNKARADMLLWPGLPWMITSLRPRLDGEDVTVGPSTRVQDVFAEWDKNIWSVPEGSLMINGPLPTLRKMPGQYPVLPGQGGYTVTFESGDVATKPDPAVMAAAEDVPLGVDLPSVKAIQEDMKFAGWATSPTATKANFTKDTPVRGDMTVYAVCQPIAPPISAFALTYAAEPGGLRYTVTIPKRDDPLGCKYSFDGTTYGDQTTITVDQGTTVTGYKKYKTTTVSASVTLPKEWEFFNVPNAKAAFFKSGETQNYSTSYFSNFERYLGNGSPTKLDKLYTQRDKGWGGSCFGFAAVEGLYNQGKMDIAPIQSGVTLNQLPNPADNHKVRDLLNYYYLTQYLNNDIDRTTYWIGTYSATAKLQELVTNVKAGQKVMFCYFYGIKKGHAFTIDGYEGFSGGYHHLTAHDNRYYDLSFDAAGKQPLTLDVKISANYTNCSVEFPKEKNDRGFYARGNDEMVWFGPDSIREVANGFECYYDFNGAPTDTTRFDPLGIPELQKNGGSVPSVEGGSESQTDLEVAAGGTYEIQFSDGRSIQSKGGKAEGAFDRQSFLLKEGTPTTIHGDTVTSGGSQVTEMFSVQSAGNTTFTLNPGAEDAQTPAVGLSVVTAATYSEVLVDDADQVTVNNTTGALTAQAATGDFSATVSSQGGGTTTVTGTLKTAGTLGLISEGNTVKLTAPAGTYQVRTQKDGLTTGTQTVTSDGTTAATITVPASAFTDIAGHWAEEDILFVARRGLLTGTGNQLFSPDIPMTRAMFVMALGRLAQADVSGYKTGHFTDVLPTDIFFGYVEWAAEHGIVKGVSATTFAPNALITRQEMATIMESFAKAMEYTIPKNHPGIVFTDADSIASWAAQGAAAMQQAGVMQGKEDKRFDPMATATRAEAAAVLHRYVEMTIDGKNT